MRDPLSHLPNCDQMDEPQQHSVRLAELVATLSLGTDLGFGRPMDHVVAQSMIAMRLGAHFGMAERDREVLYFASLLAWVGCHVDAFEQAKWFGDDISMKHEADAVDNPGPRFVLTHVGAGRTPLKRARTGFEFALGARDVAEQMLDNHWRATDALAESLGLGDAVRETLGQTFERWDGRGSPDGRRGENILLGSRLISLADVVDIYRRDGGVDAALEVARRRSGTQFDPAVVEAFCVNADELLEGVDDAESFDAILSEQTSLDRVLRGEELVAALEAVADFIDLKTPWLLGHARRVSRLAAAAATELGLPASDIDAVRLAALVQDIGRLGVSNAVWDKPSALSPSEREVARMHVYLTDRMLASTPGLAEIGSLAALHHERLDGSGYPRGLAGAAIPIAARVLAAADVYCATTEARPYRAESTAAAAEREMRSEVEAGRLDASASDAVLRCAGHAVRRIQSRPAGLTPRESEVLSLLARGRSSRQIAEELVISPKTARNHIEHIYAKIEVSNRAMASLFAVRHGLISDFDEELGSD
jgi:HD-GYP domain-containing protein (c-di-GMP phosphodiesterase class II)